MPNYGSFAGGLSQGIGQGLQFMQTFGNMQHQQTEEELRQKQLDQQLAQQKFEQQRQWFADTGKALDEAVQANPDMVPVIARSALDAFEKQQGAQVPETAKAMFLKDPIGFLQSLQTQDPQEVIGSLGNNQAFLQFAPKILAAQRESKTRTALAEEPTLRTDFEKQAGEKGIPAVIAQYQALQQTRDKLAGVGARPEVLKEFDARIKDAGDRLDKLTADPNVKSALIQAGVDPSFFSAGSFAAALAQQRGTEAAQAGAVKESEAFGTKAGQSRFDLSPTGQEQARFDVAKAGATTKAQEIGKYEAATSQQGVEAKTLDQTREFVGKSFESGLTFAREHSKLAQPLLDQKARLDAVEEALKITGPGGQIKGAAKAAVAKLLGGFFPGKDVASYETLDALIFDLVKEDVRLLAPVTGSDVKLDAATKPSYKMTEQGRQELINIMRQRLNRGFDLANRATNYLGAVSGGMTREGYDSVYSKYLQDWGNAKGGAAPTPPSGAGTSGPTGGGTVTPGPEGGSTPPAAGGGFSSLPPALRDSVGQVRFSVAQLPQDSRQRALAIAQVESGFDVNAKGAAGEVGAWQVKPSTMANPGLPGVRPLTGAGQNDPAKQAVFANQYVGALTTKYGSQRLGLAAYNAGPGVIDKFLEGTADKAIQAKANAGFNYADKVLAVMNGENPEAGTVKEKRQSLAKNVARAAVELATTFGFGKVLGSTAKVLGEGGLQIAGQRVGTALGEQALSKSVAGATLAGETAGAAAGSQLASATIDPIPDSDRQAVVSAGLTAISGPIGGLIGRMVGPKGLSENGRALVNALNKAGEPNLILPGSAVESRFVRTLQNIGDEATFTNAITSRKEQINQVLGKSGDMYATDLIAQKAKSSTLYGMVDDLMGNLKINTAPIKANMAATMKLADEGKYILQPETRKAFNEFMAGKDTLTTLEVDNLRKTLFDEWRNAFNQGEFGRATAQSRQLADLAHYFDDVVDSAMKSHPVEYQYYKQARAASLQGLQGDAIADLLARSARNSPDGTIDGKALLRYLTDYKNGPVRLTPEQTSFLKELGQGLVANQEKPSTFRIIARQAEFGGLVALGTGGAAAAATGSTDPLEAGAAAGAGLMLAPSGIAKLMASETGRKLFMKAWHASMNGPNTEAAFRAGTEFSTFLGQNAILLE